MSVLFLNSALKLRCYDVRWTISTFRMLVQFLRSNFLPYNIYVFFFTYKQLRRPWQTPSKIYDVMHVSAGTTRRRRHLYFPFCVSSSLRSVSSLQEWWFWYCEKKKKHFPLECPFKPSYRIQYPLSVSIIPCPLQLNLSGLCMKAMLVCLVHAKVVDNRHLNMHSATHPVQVPAMRLKKCCRIE